MYFIMFINVVHFLSNYKQLIMNYVNNNANETACIVYVIYL